MTSRTEITVHGVVVDDFVLLECALCGPVAVTNFPLAIALDAHVTEHVTEGATA